MVNSGKPFGSADLVKILHKLHEVYLRAGINALIIMIKSVVEMEPPENLAVIRRSGPNLDLMVGAERFELPTLCSQNRCATRLRYAPTGASITIVCADEKGLITLHRAKLHFLAKNLGAVPDCRQKFPTCGPFRR